MYSHGNVKRDCNMDENDEASAEKDFLFGNYFVQKKSNLNC